MTDKVLYAEMTPAEFRERVDAAPIAYVPLGTLEWHGRHLPLGSDGLQSEGFFCELARRVGGCVLPKLFLGPDRAKPGPDGGELYGMDWGGIRKPPYPDAQLDGSAYWVPDELFAAMLDAIAKQLVRAGFRIIVGHGHGPSTGAFRARAEQWEEQYGIRCFHCWGGEHDREGLGIQVDHAGRNETSLVMALRPELVQMERLPADRDKAPLGTSTGDADPRNASPEMGRRAIELSADRMERILRDALAEIEAGDA